MNRLFYIFFTIIACGYLFAATTPAEAKKQLKEKFKSNVSVDQTLNDVVINNIPVGKTPPAGRGVPPRFAAYIIYIDDKSDLDALSENIATAAGKRRSKGGGTLLVDIITGANKYLGRSNMNLQEIKISGTNVSSRLDDGIPVFCWLAVNKFYKTDFTDRTKLRAQASNAADWNKQLRKLEKKKFMEKTSTYIDSIICGYNKATKEYMVIGPAPEPIWLTEKEINELISDAFVLRF